MYETQIYVLISASKKAQFAIALIINTHAKLLVDTYFGNYSL